MTWRATGSLGEAAKWETENFFRQLASRSLIFPRVKPIMTKNHFETLAAALAESKPIGKTHEDMQWRADCRAIALALSRSNAQFNLAHFLRACGFEE